MQALAEMDVNPAEAALTGIASVRYKVPWRVD